jgi:hypothetical protein
MKKIFLLAVLCILFCSAYPRNYSQSVNRMLGDVSFVLKYKTLPDHTTDEQLRIKTHLSFVEGMLWQKDVFTLTSQQQRKRLEVLRHLHEYIVAGSFPVNEKYPGIRRPCFIDNHGNICAVGYLIEKTIGRSVAEAINRKHQYDYIADMKEPVIFQWANEYGLTLEECAMIQPSYGWMPPDPRVPVAEQPIRKGYGIASSLIGGANIAITVTNLSQRVNGQANRLAYLGLVTGGVQVIVGTAMLKGDRNYTYDGTYRLSYKAGNNLSYLNIATGTATIVSSLINMGINKKAKNKKSAVNFYSYPNFNNKLTVGFSFAKGIG